MLLSPGKRKEALAILEKTYFGAGPALVFTSPYELLVAVMLSAQCTDKQVNKTTAVLFQRANTPEEMLTLSLDELCSYVKSCGFYHTKAAHILETSAILVKDYGGKVPEDRDILKTLPGVGRKTANVVVSNAFNVPAIAVDTHVFRVSNRIGLAEAKNVEKTEDQLMQHIPEQDWGKAHHWLIYHGRQVCSARAPKCTSCPLNALCDAYSRGTLNEKES